MFCFCHEGHVIIDHSSDTLPFGFCQESQIKLGRRDEFPDTYGMNQVFSFLCHSHLVSITLISLSVKFIVSGLQDWALQSHVDRSLALQGAPLFMALSSGMVGESLHVPSTAHLVSDKQSFSMGFSLFPGTA